MCSQNLFNINITAVMVQVIPSFYTNYSEIFRLISAITNQNCIVLHNHKMCFLPNGRCHFVRRHRFLLQEDAKLLLQKLDTFCFNYQPVDCLFVLLKYGLNGKMLSRVDSDLKLQRAVHFNHQNRGVGRLPSLAEKRLSRKK